MSRVPHDASMLPAGPGPAFLSPGSNRKPYFHDLPEIGSLEQYYRDNFAAEFLDFLRTNLACGTLPVGRRSEEVPEPAIIYVTDARIRKIRFTAVDAERIHVEVLMDTEIYLEEDPRSGSHSDTVRQKYKICGSISFRNESMEYELFEHARIFDGWDETAYRPLSEYLVPIFSKSELDGEAERILRRWYPEVLRKPGRLDPKILAERMGLRIRTARITPDGSVYGQVFFDDSDIFIYDDPARPRKTHVRAGTILIDRYTIRKTKKTRVGLIIIHECIHYALHRFFYRLQKMYLADIQCISCPVSLDHVSSDSPVAWMEWQANQILVRMTMPESPTKDHIQQMIQDERTYGPDTDDLRIYENVISRLAEFYGSSREAMRLRMVELGYPDAEGTMIYCDDGYVPGFRYDRSRVKPNQTFTIDQKSALEEYTKNSAFRKLIDSNRFVYVESHFCLRDSKYVCPDAGHGGLCLTEYARNHVDECCLRFLVSRSSGRYSYLSGTLKREKPDTTVNVIFPEISENEYGITIREESLDEGLDHLDRIKNELPGTLAATVRFHMTRLHLTLDEMAARSHIPRRRIVQIRKGGTKVSFETALALCFGMHLEPELSYDLLNKAGHGFDDTRQDSMCQLLLRTRYYETVDKINELLTAHRLRPLTKN